MIPAFVDYLAVYDALIAWGIPANAIRLRDANFRLPDLNYISVGEFWSAYKEQLHAQGLDIWAQDWDCDDFAWDFAHEAQKSHKRRQRESGKFVAEGVGVFYVALNINQPGIAGSHAFIVVAQWDDAAGSLTFKALEPQPNSALRFYELSADEKASCSLLT